jgi:hypothetical protein
MENILKTLTSQFNESRPDYTTGDPREVNVTVLTLAQQYCMEFRYIKLSIGQPLPGEIRTMCILFQVSSTIVYKIADPDINKCLYAIDMQKTPIACIPDYSIDKTTVNDVALATGIASGDPFFARATAAAQGGGGKKEQQIAAAAASSATGPSAAVPVGVSKPQANAEKPKTPKPNSKPSEKPVPVTRTKSAPQALFQVEMEDTKPQPSIYDNLKSVLESHKTIFSTPKRVASWGAVLAGKKDDYLFGQYFQLPSLFKQFPGSLQVCHTYYTTALIYNYNTVRPYVFLNIPDGFTFTNMFVKHFADKSALSVDTIEATRKYISTHLKAKTDEIKKIAELVTAPFMDEPTEPEPRLPSSDMTDDSSSDVSSSASEASSSSVSSTVSRLGADSLAPSKITLFLLTGKLNGDAKSDADYTTSISQASQSLSEWSQYLSQSRSLSPQLPEHERHNPSSFGFTAQSVAPPGTVTDTMGVGHKGGNFTLKKLIKKPRNKTKSRNRKPTRKNLKFTIIIKKNNTKYKTYKRKANGGKLRSNKHKNNKTMRRMRCVRK